jgi:hypothetical protein
MLRHYMWSLPEYLFAHVFSRLWCWSFAGGTSGATEHVLFII